jgi:putative tricarboxylic transport membrane protein
VIVIICIVGAYSINTAAFDVGMMMAFGVIGYFLRKAKFPPAPLVLAMILGRILERSFTQTLQVSAADLAIFVEKPISATLLLVTALVMLTPAVRWLWSRRAAAQPA